MTNPNLTALCLVVDRSGSMMRLASDMNGGIRTLLAEQMAQPGEVILDVFTFDHIVEHVVQDAPLSGHIITTDYVVPRGSTALLDAVGLAVVTLGERLSKQDEDQRPSNVIVVVVTDGYENASREWSADKVKDVVTRQTDKYGWTFLYLAANVDAFATGRTMGFASTHSSNYQASTAGAQGMSHTASAAVTRSRTGTFVGYTDEERDEAAGA